MSLNTDKLNGLAKPPFAPAGGYAAWRSSAETRLAHLNRCRWSHEQAILDIDREIETLQETMGNGASGGTAFDAA
jgi:hypothetical protein